MKLQHALKLYKSYQIIHHYFSTLSYLMFQIQVSSKEQFMSFMAIPIKNT